RGRHRPFEGDAVALDRVEQGLRERGAVALEGDDPGIVRLPVDRDAARFQDAEHRFGDFGTDAISGNERDAMSHTPNHYIDWLSWRTEALQRGDASGRPVLLSLVTGWAGACAEMEAVFADPAVIAAVTAHAVPVRVDADLRPDIADRYGLG